ncbi:hypothetical protein ACFUTV_32050 [Streptomyces sp. NPDC057298]|uniref:hypothetical protein n=1 Tax=Streptomyces sp. NPDC057298 TaxID=3346091 RepID=UPI0036306368
MSAFDAAAVSADMRRSYTIAAYLVAQEESGAFDALWDVLDAALYAEGWAKIRGQYPPAGHAYPREDA